MYADNNVYELFGWIVPSSPEFQRQTVINKKQSEWQSYQQMLIARGRDCALLKYVVPLLTLSRWTGRSFLIARQQLADRCVASVTEMRLNIIIIVSTLIGCQQNRQSDNFNNLTITDSLKIMTLGQMEKASWDYYQQVEKMMTGKEFQAHRIDDYVQALIDEGSIPKPEIFIETENGTESKKVDYKTYKKYRGANPINLNRNYTFTFKLTQPDTLYKDSIRNEIIKALKVDRIK